jgi:Zn-dependent M28 family amino/carboxypeptidase
VLLVLVNDPPAPAGEPRLFGGAAMTYYGRWTYKFEEAERRGAAGMLIVHTTERAGYPWHTVVGSWAKEQRMLARDPALPPPARRAGWITDGAASGLLAQAGLDLAQLRRRAAARDFRPVPTGITLDVAFSNTVERLTSDNVVGVVRGSDPALRGEYVALSSHWDHLGIGPADATATRSTTAPSTTPRASRTCSRGPRDGRRAAAAPLAALRLRHGRGVGAARFGLLRRASHRAGGEDRRRT